jgi:hypothetical protein
MFLTFTYLNLSFLKKSGDKNLLSLDDAEVELFDFRVVIS